MNISFTKLTEAYKKEVIDIFNYYVENTTVAYRAEKVSYDFFENLIDEGVVTAYAILNDEKCVIGFCTLEKYKNLPNFSGLGDCMYFIKPEMTGKGVGKKALSLLEKDARQHGMKKIVVDISDENKRSIEFHLQNGFIEYGRLEKCWKKFGRDIGIVYMYKYLA